VSRSRRDASAVNQGDGELGRRTLKVLRTFEELPVPIVAPSSSRARRSRASRTSVAEPSVRGNDMATRTHETIDTVHEVHRLTIGVDATFDDFRSRYERAVPRLDAEVFDRLMGENADWDAVLRATAVNAPHDFIIYWTFDTTALMRMAGETWRCAQYLMGNHAIAQRMFRHHPGVMLYAPLRTVIYEDWRGVTWFSMDQPSSQFASFGDPRIAEVGIELDRKLAGLLRHLGVSAPARLTTGRAGTR
jgi:hypothetical protein